MLIRSLKSFIPVACLAAFLPGAAPAGGFDSVYPLLSSMMMRQAVPLTRVDLSARPVTQYQWGYTHRPQILRRMGCVVSGTPVEFPDDIVLTAHHLITPGTVATWSLPNTNWHGTVVLPGMMPGQQFFVAHALPGGWPAGVACRAHVN